MSRLDLFVLGFLNRKPMHGYDIICFFEKRGITIWTRVKTPSVYKALQRLEIKNYITGEMKQHDNNPPRKVFTITKAGKEYFLELLNSFLWETESSNSPMDFWNAFRFIQKNLTQTELLRVIENRKKNINKMSEVMKEKHQHALEEGKIADFPFYAKIMHKSFTKINDLELSVLNEIKAAAKLPDNQKDFKENK